VSRLRSRHSLTESAAPGVGSEVDASGITSLPQGKSSAPGWSTQQMRNLPQGHSLSRPIDGGFMEGGCFWLQVEGERIASLILDTGGIESSSSQPRGDLSHFLKCDKFVAHAAVQAIGHCISNRTGEIKMRLGKNTGSIRPAEIKNRPRAFSRASNAPHRRWHSCGCNPVAPWRRAAWSRFPN
jgi:hypothetical protein